MEDSNHLVIGTIQKNSNEFHLVTDEGLKFFVHTLDHKKVKPGDKVQGNGQRYVKPYEGRDGLIHPCTIRHLS